MYSLQVEKNLRNLDLSRNKINSLPSSIGNFKVMKTLSLSKNKISALPEDMGKMTKLENLNLSFNLLQSIPSSFQQLKHLRSLWQCKGVIKNYSNFHPTFQGGKFIKQQCINIPVSTPKPEAVECVGPSKQQDQGDTRGGPASGGHWARPQLQPGEPHRLRGQPLSPPEDAEAGGELPLPRLHPDIAPGREVRLETCVCCSFPHVLHFSKVSLLALEGNLFDVKKLNQVQGYEEYMSRYTAVKRKLD